MKKRILSLCIILLLAVSLCTPVAAAGFEDAQLSFVTDEAGLLTNEQRLELEQRAAEISQKYQCGVYIIAVNDFTDYTYESSVYEAAKDLYREYELGYGEERSGELLLLSMEARDYSLIAYGYGNTAFTDFGKDKLADEFLDDFADDAWYDGFSDYLEKSASMLASARSGKPLDVDSDPKIVFVGIGISLLLGCGLGLLLCWLLKEKQMKSVAVKQDANTYLRADGVHITNRQDQFSHITQTRTKIEKSSGGGGTTVDSDGFSGQSGKF